MAANSEIMMVMIRKAVKNDLEEIISLYRLLFTEMAMLDHDRLQPAEQSTEFVLCAIKETNFRSTTMQLNFMNMKG